MSSTGREAPATPVPGQARLESVESWSLAVAGLACAVYLLHSLPALLFPTGILASFLTLLAGVALGLAVAAGALLLAFFQLTSPARQRQQGAGSGPQLQPSPSRPIQRVSVAAATSATSATVPGDTLPHAIALDGEFSGVVYTAPASQWKRSDTVLNWPPTSDPSQPFKAWQATVSQGTLVLKPILPPPGAKPPSPSRTSSTNDGSSQQQQLALPAGAAGAGASPSKEPRPAGAGAADASGAAAAGAAAASAAATAATAAATTKVGIPLEGCMVELVADGLKGRSEFIRRAPLLVSHPKWPLLEGEQAFYLWADDPASKQQWQHALGWWCQDAEKLAAVQQMYAAYCEAMRDRSLLEYAEQPAMQDVAAAAVGTAAGAARAASGEAGGGGVAGGSSEGAAGGEAGAGEEQRQGKRGWKGWGAGKMATMKSKMRDRRRGGGGSSQELAGSGELASPSKEPGGGGDSTTASPAKPGKATAAAAAELRTLESFIDAKWMQPHKVQMPSSIPEAVVRSRHGSRATSPRAIPQVPSRTGLGGREAAGPGGAGSSSVGTAGSVLQGSSLASSQAGGFTTPTLGSSPGVPGSAQPQPWMAGPAEWPENTREGSIVGGSPTVPGLPPGSPFAAPLSPLPRPAAAAAPAAPAEREEQERQERQEGVPGGVADAGQAGEAAPSAPDGAASAPAPAVAAAVGSAFPQEQRQQQQQEPVVGVGVEGPLPEGLPPLLSPDYAVNAFVTRLCFDLLRRPDFQEHVAARIQRQLSRLQRPDFVQSLEVVGVDCGGAAPTLRTLRALPQPEASIWPQLLFDMRYQGSFTVTIEVKLELREAAAWNKLDQALTRLAHGRLPTHASGGSVAGSESQQQLALGHGQGQGQPPHHAASAPALISRSGGAEGEEGEEDGGSEGEGGSHVGALHSSGSSSGRRGFMGGIRHRAANKLRQLAETTAAAVSRIPLRVSLTFSRLEGTMCAWIPPPPGNRLFYSFVAPPLLELTARPELAGRILKYSYHIARVSSWIEHRMRTALTKNMVFPGGGDILLAALMGLEHPNVADALPALGRYMQQAAAVQQQLQPQQPPSPGARPAEPAARSQGGRVGPAHSTSSSRDSGSSFAGGSSMQQAATAAGGTPAGSVAEPEAPVASARQQEVKPPAGQEQQPPQQQQQEEEEVKVGAGSQEPAARKGADAAGQVDAVDLKDAATAAAAEAAGAEAGADAVALTAAAGQDDSGGLLQDALGESTLSMLPIISLPQPSGEEGEEQGQGAPTLGSNKPSRGATANGSSGGSGHLISPQISASSGGRPGAAPAGLQESAAVGADLAAAAPAPAAPDFHPLAPSPASSYSYVRSGVGRDQGSGHGGPSAADAWDAAIAQEGGEVDTPRLNSLQWRHPRAAGPASTGAGAGVNAGSLQSGGSSMHHLQQVSEEGEGSPRDEASLNMGVAPQPLPTAVAAAALQRQVTAPPSLQPLKLSATRSLDPDFTCSAEHTGFGEAPRGALPDYAASAAAAARRTVSLPPGHAGGEGGGGRQPGSARGASSGTREAVGAAVNRSLAYLRRQSSSLKQQYEQQQSSPPQQQAQQLEQANPPSPPLQQLWAGDGGDSRSPGAEFRQLRQQQSLKEQAGTFLKRVNAAGKAFASQVQHMQQQRSMSRTDSSSSNGQASASASPARYLSHNHDVAHLQ